MEKILIRYAEIGLKGGNRRLFEDQLIKNIKTTLNQPSLQVTKGQKQIILSGSKIDHSKLKTVFGIAWYAPIISVKTDFPTIAKTAFRLIRPQLSFALRAKRVDKTISFTSRELEFKLGEKIRTIKNIPVDLTHPQQTIHIVMNKTTTMIFNQKLPGPGGLPVATSGKVLCLLSGGFDSIAAAYLLAKRGAQVDYLHFHVFPNSTQVLKSKIKTIVNALSVWTLSKKIFLASYLPFQLAVMDLQAREVNQELIVYRRLMARVGEVLALKHGYQVLVLGDSLGQVASQTMDNLVALDQAVQIPVFRPLIGWDKKEIIDQVKTIGLEAVSNLSYKDCCSLISTHPATTVNWLKLTNLEKRLKIEKIIKKITQDVQIIDF